MSVPTSKTSPSSAGPAHAPRRLLAAATAVTILLAFLPGAEVVTYPIRLFSTLIHEGGHALVVTITGGHVTRMAILPNTNGVTEYQVYWGGWTALINMAGYIGTTVFGALCLHLGRGRRGKAALIFLAVVALTITVVWIRPWDSLFGFATGIGIAALLILGAAMLREPAALFLASFLSVQISLNALYGLRDLLWLTSHRMGDNDAVFMAQQYGLSPVFWAALWALVSVMILGLSLRIYWRDGKSASPGRNASVRYNT